MRLIQTRSGRSGHSAYAQREVNGRTRTRHVEDGLGKIMRHARQTGRGCRRPAPGRLPCWRLNISSRRENPSQTRAATHMQGPRGVVAAARRVSVATAGARLDSAAARSGSRPATPSPVPVVRGNPRRAGGCGRRRRGRRRAGADHFSASRRKAGASCRHGRKHHHAHHTARPPIGRGNAHPRHDRTGSANGGNHEGAHRGNHKGAHRLQRQPERCTARSRGSRNSRCHPAAAGITGRAPRAQHGCRQRRAHLKGRGEQERRWGETPPGRSWRAG